LPHNKSAADKISGAKTRTSAHSRQGGRNDFIKLDRVPHLGRLLSQNSIACSNANIVARRKVVVKYFFNYKPARAAIQVL